MWGEDYADKIYFSSLHNPTPSPPIHPSTLRWPRLLLPLRRRRLYHLLMVHCILWLWILKKKTFCGFSMGRNQYLWFVCLLYDGNSQRLNRKWFYGEAGNRTCDPWFSRHSAYSLHHGGFRVTIYNELTTRVWVFRVTINNEPTTREWVFRVTINNEPTTREWLLRVTINNEQTTREWVFRVTINNEPTTREWVFRVTINNEPTTREWVFRVTINNEPPTREWVFTNPTHSTIQWPRLLLPLRRQKLYHLLLIHCILWLWIHIAFRVTINNEPSTRERVFRVTINNEPPTIEGVFRVIINNEPTTMVWVFRVTINNEPRKKEWIFRVTINNEPTTREWVFWVTINNEQTTIEWVFRVAI